MKLKVLLKALIDPGNDGFGFDNPAWPYVAVILVVIVVFIIGAVAAIVSLLR